MLSVLILSVACKTRSASTSRPSIQWQTCSASSRFDLHSGSSLSAAIRPNSTAASAARRQQTIRRGRNCPRRQSTLVYQPRCRSLAPCPLQRTPRNTNLSSSERQVRELAGWTGSQLFTWECRIEVAVEADQSMHRAKSARSKGKNGARTPEDRAIKRASCQVAATGRRC